MTLSRKFTAVAWIVCGLIVTAGMIATPWESSTETADYLTTIGTNSTQGQIAAMLLHFGYMAMVPAFFGLYWQMRDRAGKLGTIGGVLAVFGALGLSGLLVVDFYAIALQQNLPIDQAVEIEDAVAGMAGAAVIQMTTGIPMMIGSILLVIGAYRKGLAPLWAAIVMPVGQILPMAGAPVLSVISGVTLLAVGLGIAQRLMRGDAARPARVETATAAA